ncbi:MAG: exodeoxyribonuclease VII small subunit [Cyanobacteriota bacterium]|nr:exodeoxyribonuclease VII small subunit [Cyanobacteriota bacterium]
MAETRKTSRRRPAAAAADPDPADDLSYSEARTALELSLAELQATDLDVEAMVGLYRRAEAYAQRCEQLLNQVEQEVRLWSSDDPDSTPTPYSP